MKILIGSVLIKQEMYWSHMKKVITIVTRNILLAGCLLTLVNSRAIAAQVMDSLVPEQNGVNLVGAVIGKVPEYWGSSASATGLAPMFRKQLSGEQYLQFMGAELTYNMLDHSHWRVGPSIGVRFGRDEVSDAAVRQMTPIKSTGEVGMFVGYTDQLSEDVRHRWGFNLAMATATSDVYSGMNGSASVHWLKPLLPWFTASASAGLGFGSSGFQSTYFGVNAHDSILFPSLAGRTYKPDGGVTDVRMLVGGLVHFSESWHLVTGVRWQKLLGSAADSPLVRDRGNETQWIFGAGLVYMWR